MRGPRSFGRGADAVVPALSLVGVLLTLAYGCRQKSAPAPAAPPSASGRADAAEPAPSPSPDVALPAGTLRFEVIDSTTRRPIPCKLGFEGKDGTPRPRFSTTDVPSSIDGGVAAYSRVYSLAGRGSLRVPLGTYDVTVSHGPEWSVQVQRGLVVGDRGATLEVALSHELPTPGWLSADLHVHAAPSWDSAVPLGARVHEFAAESVDVLVASDHNVITDYTTTIDELGAERAISTVSGVEISTVDWGHFGAFPMVRDDDWWVLRGVRMKGAAAGDLLRGVRKRDPRALISVNHPRLGKMGYFNRADFNPVNARVGKAKATLDFDAVEIMNGYKDARLDHVDRVLADWFSLVLHGRRVVVVGNSDTHHLRYSVAGYPRNYVSVSDDSVGATGGEQLADGIKAGRSFVTTGPMLDVTVNGRGLGSIVPAKGAAPKLRAVVRAASWISVDKLSVLVDGKVVQSWDVPESTGVERISVERELAVDRDAFVVVRVEGAKSLEPVVGGGRLEPVPVFAFTNPIYLDADGNGRYDAPLR